MGDYTKGEWGIGEHGELMCGGWQLGAVFLQNTKRMSGEMPRPNENEANGYLISATPRLYEELLEADRVICELCKRLNPQHATADYGKGCNSCQDRETRLKALAKAEGK